MKKEFLEAGQIVGTHGVRGEMRVDPWMDSPEALKKIKKLYLDEGRKDLGLKTSRVHKSQLLITVEGIDNPTQADTMRGKVLYFNRNDVKLPEGRYFIDDLIGLEVFDGNTGANYGIIYDVIQAPANDVYKIIKDEKEYLFPAVKHMIKNTDIDANRIEILPIPGIFDDDVIEDKE
ncbi:MAG: ribosome maturation factor RimM [Clostridia bacterium]|nr:ribosome maturation factor RimM [Clostridia bacterium]